MKCLPGQGWCSRDTCPDVGCHLSAVWISPSDSLRFLFHKTGRVSKPYWAPKNWHFWTVVLGKILESALESKESILKEINSECSLEGLILKLKLQYFWPPNVKELTHWKRPWGWERLRASGEGVTEDEMVGWHPWLNGHEFEQAPGDGEGQGSLACCSLWGCKESDMIQWLNKSNNKPTGWTRMRNNEYYYYVKCLALYGI